MNTNLFPLRSDPAASDYLRGAKAAGEYVRQYAVRSEKGVYWQKYDEVYWNWDKNDKPQIGLYSGVSGIVLFFLHLAKANRDDSYLWDAKNGGDYILNELEKSAYEYPIKTNFHMNSDTYSQIQWTLHAGGFAGIAFTLIELSKALGGNAAYEKAAEILTDKIAAAAKPVEGGLVWSGRSGVTQDSGTILYLLYAAKHFNKPAWRETARRGGTALLTTGTQIAADSVRYNGFINTLQELFGGDPHDFEADFFPNFAYGTAGISYTLARIYEETKDPRFLEAAEKGATYLSSIAVPVKEGKLIPYHYPNNDKEIFYLGFCHGPVGTARLYVLLHRLTGKQAYKDFYLDLARGIIGAGAPEYHSAGYWDCHCQCCGTAGFVNLFLGVWLETGDAAYLDYALRAGKALLGSANYDGEKASWYQAFMRTEPGHVSSDIGYFDGVAGIGTALSQIFLALDKRFETIRLPDDPFLKSAI